MKLGKALPVSFGENIDVCKIAHLQALFPSDTIKKKGQVTDMFRKKQQKRIVELSHAEVRLVLTALMNFRNKVMNAGKPTEDINDLILMITK